MTRSSSVIEDVVAAVHHRLRDRVLSPAESWTLALRVMAEIHLVTSQRELDGANPVGNV